MPEELNLNPPATECTQTIGWKYRDDKQAKATCLEYFSTTYVEGRKGANDDIECTVSRQFQCHFLPNSFSMIDKCYTFSNEEITMNEYLKKNVKNYCPDKGGEKGGIPVFLTMT
ncbi:hypothetical protein PENTCL1PPCAC_26890 [Pristionchus entomophagus]|uniref:Uncharacterized protein n=1 Tax=Pristionchus entomophagus TaxID=358040 RepID=A0AAV5UE49_9BILA|nr:hypothetical protein PENTCL1PPCAC_26890 [Pristionchus entomophagus]